MSDDLVYRYKAEVVDVYDGDTCTLKVDLGFNMSFVLKARLYGVDTPELRSKDDKEKARAYKARDFVREITRGKEVRIETHKQGKYGRYLVDLFVEDEGGAWVKVNSLLILRGLAKAYYGGKR